MEMISLPYKFGAWHADLALETSPEESQNDEAKVSRKVGQTGRPVGPEEALRGALEQEEPEAQEGSAGLRL